MPNKIDETAARAAFEHALAHYEQDFGTFFLARLFGLEISFPDPETCLVTLDVKDFMFNPQGTLHGGVIAFMLDISMGHLLKRSIGAGMTLEMKTQYLRPARAGRIRAEGRFLKKGKSINYLETRLFDAGGNLLAAANSTWQLLPQGAAAN
jgi:acyl-CoA thioesterase